MGIHVGPYRGQAVVKTDKERIHDLEEAMGDMIHTFSNLQCLDCNGKPKVKIKNRLIPKNRREEILFTFFAAGFVGVIMIFALLIGG